MSDIEALLLVILIIYLLECVYWTPRGSVAVRSLFGLPCNLAHPSAFVGNRNGGFVGLNPLPPFDPAYICNQYALSLSPHAAYSYVSQAINPEGRPDQLARYVPFDEMQEITVDGSKISINGDLFSDVGSPHLATHLVDLLRTLAATTKDLRSEVIDEELASITNVDNIRKEARYFKDNTRYLLLWCHLVFIELFVFVPCLFILPRSALLWSAYGIVIVLITVCALSEFHSSHKALYPQWTVERWTKIALMCLMPPSVIRARCLLARELLALYHPLAVVHALCTKMVIRRVSQNVLRDLRFPMMPVCPSNDPEVQETERWFRCRLQSQLENVVLRSESDLDALVMHARSDDPECRSYCPRCGQQYVLLQGGCDACGGIELMRCHNGNELRE